MKNAQKLADTNAALDVAAVLDVAAALVRCTDIAPERLAMVLNDVAASLKDHARHVAPEWWGAEAKQIHGRLLDSLFGDLDGNTKAAVDALVGELEAALVAKKIPAARRISAKIGAFCERNFGRRDLIPSWENFAPDTLHFHVAECHRRNA